MKNQLLILTSLFCIYGTNANAQSVTIDPKANNTPIFEIKSTTEGMVMPKLTVAQRNVMAGLTAGTQVYCTDCTPYGPYNYDGGSWVAMFQTQTVSPITYTVGQAAQGGIVFWIDPASGGQHGLVAGTYDVVSPNDGSSSFPWENLPPGSYEYKSTCAVRTGFYGGAENTKVIENSLVGLFLTKYIGDYLGNSNFYGDWHIPSREELRLMYSLRNTIGGFSTSSISRYWTSSEYFAYSLTAWCVDFSNGNTFFSGKRDEYKIRPIRRF